jgi:CBS domain-containing membrane protein
MFDGESGKRRRGMERDPGAAPDISDDDVYAAMKEIEGYLDITPGDFKVLYRLAYKHAVARMARSVKARDVMTRDVVKVGRDAPVTEVARIMASRSISGLPVVDAEDRVVGVISEKDFVSRLCGGKDLHSFMEVVASCLIPEGRTPLFIEDQKAEGIMTRPPVTVSEEATISEIASLMAEKRINRVPVTDGEGRLVGIVARADIVQTSCTIALPPRT